MTIKSYNAVPPDLALSEIQTEFGGANPIDLSEYYAGNGLVTSGTVGYPNGSAVAIPSPGNPISISNFYGASAEPNAVALANYFWNNRANLVRYSNRDIGLSYYPGDNYRQTDYSARHVSNFTRAWNYSNSGLPASSIYYTVVSAAIGYINNYPVIQTTSLVGEVGSPGSLLHDFGPYTFVGDGGQPTPVGNGYGINIKTQTFAGQVRSTTFNSIYSTHGGSNQGAWVYCWMIPGKWAFQDGQAQFNFDGYNYSRTIEAGKMHFMFVERGGDYPNPLPTPSGAANVMTADQNWYNAAGVQVVVNTSSSAIYPSWPASGPIVGQTPIVGAILTNF